jgi:hypothetical protein
MNKEELLALTLRVGEKIEEWLKAEGVDTHFILLAIERVEGNDFEVALTSSSDNVQMIAETLHDYGAEMLRGNVEISMVEGENERKN